MNVCSLFLSSNYTAGSLPLLSHRLKYTFFFISITSFFFFRNRNKHLWFSPLRFLAGYWHHLISEMRRLGWTGYAPCSSQSLWFRAGLQRGGRPGLGPDRQLTTAGAGLKAGLRDTTGHSSWRWGLWDQVKPPEGVWKMCSSYSRVYLLLEI